jgi:hypothetical protein
MKKLCRGYAVIAKRVVGVVRAIGLKIHVYMLMDYMAMGYELYGYMEVICLGFEFFILGSKFGFF